MHGGPNRCSFSSACRRSLSIRRGLPFKGRIITSVPTCHLTIRQKFLAIHPIVGLVPNQAGGLVGFPFRRPCLFSGRRAAFASLAIIIAVRTTNRFGLIPLRAP